ncbi:hypothetical protein [Bremerella cremea]|uniref:hypothetical protein n=1 Tax=Bremerella cremea TaxID=1031537 RepID=UPI0031ED03D8
MTPEPHIIRLNGPWEMLAGLPDEAARVKLPADWPQIVDAVQQGPVVLQRWFHRPTGIDDGSQVQLRLENFPFGGTVSVNDVSLGAFPALEEQAMAIEMHLEVRNCLTITAGTMADLEGITTIPLVSLAILPAS